MIDLASYIYKLLSNHECVVVPGLGGFITRKKSAMVHATQNLFIPPSKHLMFNARLTHNDGLLVHLIARENNISYETAVSRVSALVDNIFVRLYKNEKVTFQNIGTLTYQNGLLKFEADQGINIQDESYGLNSFMMPLLSAQEQRPVYIKTKKEQVKKERKPRKPPEKYQIAAIVTFLLLGLVMVLFYITPVQSYIKSDIRPKVLLRIQDASVALKKITSGSNDPVSGTEKIASDTPGTAGKETTKLTDSDPTTIDPDTYDFSIPGMEVIGKPGEGGTSASGNISASSHSTGSASMLSSHSGKHYVVVGSFQSLENAEKLTAEIQNKGYKNAEVLKIPNSAFYRVSVQHFNDPDEATECMKTVVRQLQLNAWVFSPES